jgi:anti-sigma regulatory factor (Ser/Thr protein kinase)
VKELTIDAKVENVEVVTAFVKEELQLLNCSSKVLMQIEVAIDELFSNIAYYAYEDSKGKATVRVEISKDPLAVIITFIDDGIPYDPLKKKDPNTLLSADERQAGGLGIYLVKKMMDEIVYEYKEGKNILSIKKHI